MHRGNGVPGAALVAAVLGATLPEGSVQAEKREWNAAVEAEEESLSA